MRDPRLLLNNLKCNTAVGVFGFKTVLTHRMTMGYVEVETTKNSVLMAPGRTARGQVFHYTEIVEVRVV